MSRLRVTAAISVTVFFLAGEVFAQAAAETVLTHGLSAGAASTVGKTLGNTLGSAAGRVAGKLGQQTSSAPVRQPVVVPRNKNLVPTTTTPAASTTTNSTGSLIASIQGGEMESAQCPPAAKPSNDGAPQASPSNTSPATANCAVPSEGAKSHPAVVNLPPAH